jgi:hypothetical protein
LERLNLTIDGGFEEERAGEHHFIPGSIHQPYAKQEMTMEGDLWIHSFPDTLDTYALQFLQFIVTEKIWRSYNLSAFRPLEVIRKTLENTTQLAKAVNAPTTRHL